MFLAVRHSVYGNLMTSQFLRNQQPSLSEICAASERVYVRRAETTCIGKERMRAYRRMYVFKSNIFGYALRWTRQK
jgi:hypothetical protein